MVPEKPADPVNAEMTAKLNAMTPEERSQYVQQHPDEVKNAYSAIKPNP